MTAVIDANVAAYLLLGTEAFVDEARACLEQVSTPLAPAHCEAELTNVVWMAVRAGVSAYDTLFVELAARSACPLATFDAALLKAFPEVARRPRDLGGR